MLLLALSNWISRDPVLEGGSSFYRSGDFYSRKTTITSWNQLVLTIIVEKGCCRSMSDGT